MVDGYSSRNLELILAYLNVKISSSTLLRWHTEEKRGRKPKVFRATRTRKKMIKDFALLDDSYFEQLKDTPSLKVIYNYALGLRGPLPIDNTLIGPDP